MVNVYYFIGVISGVSGSLTFQELKNDFGSYTFNNNSTNCVFEFGSLPFGELNTKYLQISTSMAPCFVSPNDLAGNYQFSVPAPTALEMQVWAVYNADTLQHPFSVNDVVLTLKYFQNA